MTDHPNSDPTHRTTLAPRRLTLLASVAVLGLAIVAGPSFYHSHALTFGSPAQAAETQAPSQTPSGFADLVSKVKPAVIAVRVKIDQAASPVSMNENDQSQSGSIPPGFEQFFRQFGGNGMRQAQPHQLITGLGSGFFISADGYAVTNNHVVNHATSVQVTTDDGVNYTAKVIGTDPKTDLALIKVDGKGDLPFVKFADNAPRIGDWVVAVGNPFGLGGTVTAGIVSASGRDIGSGPYDDYIQIDAPINKGNSGGPAFDMNGHVIGINTAIYSPSGGSVGIGFDVPAQTAKQVVAQLKDHGHVTRGWIGVQVQPVTAAIADSLGLKTARGALIDEPQANSPAAKAGLQSGDVITAIDGKAVKDARDLARKIGLMSPGSSIKLDVMRNGSAKTMTLALGTMPDQHQAQATPTTSESDSGVPHLGLSVAPASDVSGAGGKGLVVTNVDPAGLAADNGIRTGDVILDVGGKTVANAGDVRKALSAAKAQGKHDVLMRVKSSDTTRFVALPIANG